MDEERLAEVARALGNPARLRILDMLATQAECSGSEVFSGLTLAQSTISEHLRVLRDAGLVASRPAGTSTLYCVRRDALDQFAATVQKLADSAPSCSPAEKNGTRR